jgi:hypothetical protein
MRFVCAKRAFLPEEYLPVSKGPKTANFGSYFTKRSNLAASPCFDRRANEYVDEKQSVHHQDRS